MNLSRQAVTIFNVKRKSGINTTVEKELEILKEADRKKEWAKVLKAKTLAKEKARADMPAFLRNPKNDGYRPLLSDIPFIKIGGKEIF